MSRYLRPRSLEEALEIRAGGPITVLAGGTDVYPARTARVGWGDMRRPDVLDVSAVPGLRGIARVEDGWRIGATTTWSAIARAELPPVFAGLQGAARVVGGAQIQNRGTVAGNLCTASPAGDGIPALMSLDAKVELASLRGIRRLPVTDFVDGYRHTALAADELVTAVIVPDAAPGEAGLFLKLGARAYLVISIAMAAGTLALDAGGRIARIRLAVGACGPVAKRLTALEARLAGLEPLEAAAAVTESDLEELSPIDDVRASAEYRRAAALSLVRDLVAGLAGTGTREAA